MMLRNYCEWIVLIGGLQYLAVNSLPTRRVESQNMLISSDFSEFTSFQLEHPDSCVPFRQGHFNNDKDKWFHTYPTDSAHVYLRSYVSQSSQNDVGVYINTGIQICQTIKNLPHKPLKLSFDISIDVGCPTSLACRDFAYKVKTGANYD